MATEPEALAQLARLLGNNAVRTSTEIEMRAAASAGIERLAGGLVSEAAASDDVSDRESAVEFLEARVKFLNDLLEPEAKTRLWQAIQAKIDAW